MRVLADLPFGKTARNILFDHSPSGGYKRPSESRIPLIAPESGLRYFSPQEPGNCAFRVDKSNVLSSSSGTSIDSSLSSSATWMYLLIPDTFKTPKSTQHFRKNGQNALTPKFAAPKMASSVDKFCDYSAIFW